MTHDDLTEETRDELVDRVISQAATLERVRVLAYSSAGLVAEAIRRALGPAPAKDPRKQDCPAHDTRCTEERCHWLTKHPLDRPIPRMQGPAPAQAEPVSMAGYTWVKLEALEAAEARCAELEDKLQREQCLSVELEVKLEKFEARCAELIDQVKELETALASGPPVTPGQTAVLKAMAEIPRMALTWRASFEGPKLQVLFKAELARRESEKP